MNPVHPDSRLPTAHVSIGFAHALPALVAEFITQHELAIDARRAGDMAIVFGPNVQKEFASAIGQVFKGRSSTSVFGGRFRANIRTPWTALANSRRITIDIDALAPRLREVRLPAAIAGSDALIGACDLRQNQEERPVIVLGLWAQLASPVHRIGARITGPREGLTAEIGLAVAPDGLIVMDKLTSSGPLFALIGNDPVAIELLALSFRQLRSRAAIDLPGPWEDPLVQRATELGLGITLPSQIAIAHHLCSDLNEEDRHLALERMAGALRRIGIDPASSHK